MSRTIPSHAEPAMLRWCRKTARLSEEQIADVLNNPSAKEPTCTEQMVIDWESGKGGPSFAQLKKIAKKCKYPVSVFYLPKPPTDFTVVKDFRRMHGASTKEFSPELAYFVRTIRERQEWMSEHIVASGGSPITFVGKVSLDADPTTIGQKLRKLLRVTVQEQKSWRSKEEAFGKWRRRCEAVGVCVFVSNTVEHGEMRGFALPDRYAPAICVNGNDALAARVFTLLHEMVHILLGLGGVSDLEIEPSPRSDTQKIEAFCNAVAAEAAVPSDELRDRFINASEVEVNSKIATLAMLYRVSDEVVNRRLFDLDLLSKATYERNRSMLNTRREIIKRDGDMKIQFAKRVMHWTGQRFSRMAISAFHDGDIGGAELSGLLNMRLQHLAKLERNIFPSRFRTEVDEEDAN